MKISLAFIVFLIAALVAPSLCASEAAAPTQCLSECFRFDDDWHFATTVGCTGA